MFVKSTNKVEVTQRVVATLVACAVVMATVGIYNTAQAANLTDVSNVMTDSTPSVLSGHEIAFTIPTGSTLSAASTFDIAFPAGFVYDGTMATGDFTVDVAGNAEAVDSYAVVGQVITLSLDTVANATEEVVITIAPTEITNPAKVLSAGVGDSYEITINTPADSGNARIVIIDNVVVTAEVATSFEFEVRPVATSTTVNGEATTIASASTSIPFGELVAGDAEFIAQQLSVTTNAINGFVVTVEKGGELISSTAADIDTFTNGSNETTPGAWASPTGTLVAGEDGWGHWGMTTEDGDVNTAGAPNFAGSDEFIAVLNTPQAIFGHNSVCDGVQTGAGDASTDDTCLTEVGYKIEISALQEAGDDYIATLTYIATPKF
jgi:hypothetical protein